MVRILIILKNKWPQGFICPCTGTIFYKSNMFIGMYSRSQVSVYRTIGPLVSSQYLLLDNEFSHFLFFTD